MTTEEFEELRKILPVGTEITVVSTEEEWRVIQPKVAPHAQVRRFKKWRVYLVSAVMGIWGAYVVATDQFPSYFPKAEVLIARSYEAAQEIYADFEPSEKGLVVLNSSELNTERYIVFRSDSDTPPVQEPPSDRLVDGYSYFAMANVAPEHYTMTLLRPSGSANA